MTLAEARTVGPLLVTKALQRGEIEFVPQPINSYANPRGNRYATPLEAKLAQRIYRRKWMRRKREEMRRQRNQGNQVVI